MKQKQPKPTYPHCGRIMVSYIKTLSPGVVSAAAKFKLAVAYYGRNALHLKRDMKGPITPPEIRLTDSEWTNFPILREFGIVVHHDNENRKSGYWVLTTRGNDFLKGMITLPHQIVSVNGHPVGPANTRVLSIRDFYRKIPWFEQSFATESREGAVENTKLF